LALSVTFPAVFRTMITVHADVVGSLLRPSDLIEARIRLAAGEIDASRFREIEDRAVCGAIAMKEAAELEIVTDGEMRRQSFQSQMTAAVEGFGDFSMDAFLWASGTMRKEQSAKRARQTSGQLENLSESAIYPLMSLPI
jgi:methionine synthase II (cobalamin-independent)